MNNTLFQNFLRFVGLLLLQVLVASHLQLGFYINPYVYPLFLMMLPFSIPQGLLLLIGFLTGLTVDAFSNTFGIHAAACTFMIFIRPVILRLLTPKSSYENMVQPRLHSLGYLWFFLYTGLLTFFHHLIYFFLEVFSFNNFLITLGKVLLSTSVSVLIIMLMVFIFSSGRRRN
ncbi:MAG: rod shape-determining protein MreD [Chitinophagales bacterium]|nr:MAG: rod shape-determining protein MreD [Chitinophagales bacterium]